MGHPVEGACAQVLQTANVPTSSGERMFWIIANVAAVAVLAGVFAYLLGRL